MHNHQTSILCINLCTLKSIGNSLYPWSQAGNMALGLNMLAAKPKHGSSSPGTHSRRRKLTWARCSLMSWVPPHPQMHTYPLTHTKINKCKKPNKPSVSTKAVTGPQLPISVTTIGILGVTEPLAPLTFLCSWSSPPDTSEKVHTWIEDPNQFTHTQPFYLPSSQLPERAFVTAFGSVAKWQSVP